MEFMFSVLRMGCKMGGLINQRDITALENKGGGKAQGVCPITTGTVGAGTYLIYHMCFGTCCAVWDKDRDCCGVKR